MTNGNPYESPQHMSVAPRPALADNRLRVKARALLRRRDEGPQGASYRWYFSLRQYLLFTAAYVLLIAALCAIGSYYLAVAFAGFVAGRLVRDLQWVLTLSREWEPTKELIDWDKVQRLADEFPKEKK